MDKYRYTIITCNFDDYEVLREVKDPLSDVEYIYVTNDMNVRSNSWKIIYDPFYNTLQNSFDKVVEFRRRVLSYCSTDICCRIDGSVKITGDAFEDVINEFNNGGYDIAFIMHPWFSNICNEYNMWNQLRGMPSEEVEKVKSFFIENSYDFNLNTVYTLTMLIQRNNETCRNINEQQYNVLQQIKEYSNVDHFNRCDQAVFTYTMDKYFNTCKVLPLDYTILERKNKSHIFFHKSEKNLLCNKHASFHVNYTLFGEKLFKIFNGEKWVGILTNSDVKNKAIKILLKSTDKVHPNDTNFIPNKNSYNDWFTNEDVITIGTSNIDDYLFNDPCNKHHYNLDWYYKKLLPIVVSELGIPYNENDFVDIYKDNIYCKIPKKVQDLDIYCPRFKTNPNGYVEVFYDMDCLHLETTMTAFMCNELFKQDFYFTANDAFHKIFKYCHVPVKIVNYNATNNDILLLVGNSHTIPFVPILTKYFHKVILIDNRLENFTYDFLFSYENITHMMVLASYDTNKNKLLNVTRFD